MINSTRFTCSHLWALALAGALTACVDTEDTDAPADPVAQVADAWEPCIDIGHNPSGGPRTLCGPFARRWNQTPSPLASFGWPAYPPVRSNGTLGLDLDVPSSHAVMVFERGAMNTGPGFGGACQGTACISLMGTWYIHNFIGQVHGGFVGNDCGNPNLIARAEACLDPSQAHSYQLTGGLERWGFPMSTVKSGGFGNAGWYATQRMVFDHFPQNPPPWNWAGRLIGNEYLAKKQVAKRGQYSVGKAFVTGNAGLGCTGVYTGTAPGCSHNDCTIAKQNAFDSVPAHLKQNCTVETNKPCSCKQ